MRALGWATTHDVHELRAWAGCQIATLHPQGLLAAQIFLRHAHYSTTQNYYGHHQMKKFFCLGAHYSTTQNYYGHHLKIRLDKVSLTIPAVPESGGFVPRLLAGGMA